MFSLLLRCDDVTLIPVIGCVTCALSPTRAVYALRNKNQLVAGIAAVGVYIGIRFFITWIIRTKYWLTAGVTRQRCAESAGDTHVDYRVTGYSPVAGAVGDTGGHSFAGSHTLFLQFNFDGHSGIRNNGTAR